MTIQSAIEFLKREGYRVSKPRKPRKPVNKLNAIGKPYSPLYDPRYKIKTPLTSIARLRGPQNFPWVIHTPTR